jgi:heme-degrading monooxygenase HmoA
MFSVIFEVHPKPDQWDAYLGYAKMLRPELELIDGFIDNIRYRSLTRKGWILSLSGWRDEKALVRWRTLAKHHEVQERGAPRCSSTTICASAR